MVNWEVPPQPGQFFSRCFRFWSPLGILKPALSSANDRPPICDDVLDAPDPFQLFSPFHDSTSNLGLRRRELRLFKVIGGQNQSGNPRRCQSQAIEGELLLLTRDELKGVLDMRRFVNL